MDILFLAGKRPRPGTILADAEARLSARGLDVHIEWRDPIAAFGVAPESVLVVHRGLDPDLLARLAAQQPTRVVNPPLACRLAADRGAALSALRRARLPVPESMLTSDWAEVHRLASAGPVFLKAASGVAGRGTGVVPLLDGAMPDPPMPGPWHVERSLPGDGVDRKLYVAGSRVFGLLKPWPRDCEPARPFEPQPPLVELARATGQALGLDIFGVDLVGHDGEFGIVDVNPFPGFRGVEGAADAVADHIAARMS